MKLSNKGKATKFRYLLFGYHYSGTKEFRYVVRINGNQSVQYVLVLGNNFRGLLVGWRLKTMHVRIMSPLFLLTSRC